MNPSKETKYLSPVDKQKLLEVMYTHFQTYLRARSLTPYIDKAMVDDLSSRQARTCFGVPTAPLYQGLGYACHIVFELDQFDTDEKYQQYQDIGHWINQSFLIELKCILDSFITNWSRCPLRDEAYFRLLEKCRHLFAHSSYKLNYKTRIGHEQDYEQAIAQYNQLFGHLGDKDHVLNLSITDFVIPFYLKLVELINKLL